MALLGLRELGVILEAERTDSVVTLSFDSDDCDADYRAVNPLETIKSLCVTWEFVGKDL